MPLVLVCTPGASAAVTGLRDALGAAGEALGFWDFAPTVYVPHLTLSYGPTAIPETVLDEPMVWRPRELVLVHSHQGAGRRVVLGRWPFRG